MDATCHGYYVQLFEGFFPKQLLQNVIDIVNEKMDGDEEVVYGEFIQWIGIWVLMSTVDGVDQRSFWSTKNVDAFDSFQMHLISMEETWMTMRWANCMFCFLLTITIVTIQNAAVYFLNKPKLDA